METATVIFILLGISTTLSIYAIVRMGKSITKLQSLLKEYEAKSKK